MTMKESGPSAARLPQLPGPPLMMINHQIWWRSGSIISDPDWSHLVPRASWLHCRSVSKLLVLTTVAGRCSEKHSATAKKQNWPQTEISMAVVDVWHSSGVLSHAVYEKKKDIKPLSRTLGHVIYLMRSLPLRFGTDPDSRRSSEYSVYPVRRARLCSNSTQHNVNFEETNTRQTSEPICSHLITTRKHS